MSRVTGESAKISENIEKELKKDWLDNVQPKRKSRKRKLLNEYPDYRYKRRKIAIFGSLILKRLCFSSTTDAMQIKFPTLNTHRGAVEKEMCYGIGAQCRNVNGVPIGYDWKGDDSKALNSGNCLVNKKDNLNDDDKTKIKTYGGIEIPWENNDRNDKWINWESTNCWLSGLPIAFSNNKDKPECEHKLPVLFLILYGAGPATKINESGLNISDNPDVSQYDSVDSFTITASIKQAITPEYIEWKKTVRSFSYAWSHKICNQTKNAMLFVRLTVKEINGNHVLKYEIVDDLIKKYAKWITCTKDTSDILASNNKKTIWTDKRGDWATIHRRSFFNFDTSQEGYESEYDGLQVWRNSNHPLYEVVRERTRIKDKTKMIKRWLKKKSGWYSMVKKNLKKSLLPLVMELNKGNKGLTPYTRESQLAIFKTLINNKKRLEYYIKKGNDDTIGDGSDDWNKISQSYNNIKEIIKHLDQDEQIQASNKIKEMKDFFSKIFISNEEETTVGGDPTQSRLKEIEMVDVSNDEFKPDEYIGLNDYIDINVINISKSVDTFIPNKDKSKGEGEHDYKIFDNKGEYLTDTKEIYEMDDKEKEIEDRRKVIVPKKIFNIEKIENMFDDEAEAFLNESQEYASTSDSGSESGSSDSFMKEYARSKTEGEKPLTKEEIQLREIVEDINNWSDLAIEEKNLYYLLNKHGKPKRTSEIVTIFKNYFMRNNLELRNNDEIRGVLWNKEKPKFGPAYELFMMAKDDTELELINNAVEIFLLVWKKRKHTKERLKYINNKGGKKKTRRKKHRKKRKRTKRKKKKRRTKKTRKKQRKKRKKTRKKRRK